MIGKVNKFETRQALAQALADRLVDWACHCKPPGRLELSGGSTPKELLANLGARALPVALDVLPVDDRCVPLAHEYSNAGLLQAALGGDHNQPVPNQPFRGQSFRVQPLYHESKGVGGSVEALKQALSCEGNRPRFCVLGLGTDGHTASLFPGSADLPTGLDACAPIFISAQPTRAPMVPRITMTAPYILGADQLALHFHGPDKWALFERAKTSPAALHPIAHFLRHPHKSLDVYYAP